MKPKGALCDRCPLQGQKFIRTEKHGSDILIVGDSPSQDDEKHGRAFAGSDAIELSAAMRQAGARRLDFDITHAVACRGELKKIDRQVAKARKSDPNLLTPEQACAPRLRRELRAYSGVIPVGALATRVVLQSRASIFEVRGALAETTEEGETIKVLPTVSPRLVQIQQRYRPIFYKDFGKALRYFSGTLQWDEPRKFAKPTVEKLQRFFDTYDEIVVDIETVATRWKTNGDPIFDPLDDRIRCIGFSPVEADGKSSFSLIVPFASVDGGHAFYPKHELREIWQCIRTFFEDPTKRKIGHNFGSYDALVLDAEARRRKEEAIAWVNLFDTLLAHHIAHSEHRHGLDFVASILTDAPSWKQGHTAVKAKTDKELWGYCGRDTAINARIYPELHHQIRSIGALKPLHPGFRSLWEVEHGMQEVCRYMHEVGMPVDQEVRTAHAIRLQSEKVRWEGEAHKALQACDFRASINLNSRDQVADVLFNAWDLPLANNVSPKDLFTEAEERSTGDTILRSYLSDRRLTKAQQDFVHALRMYRRSVKNQSFVHSLKPEFSNDRCKLRQDTRRVHSNWKAHGTLVGRLASDTPNMANVTAELRNVFAARPGYKFIDCDQDAIHLRIIASVWKIPSLQEAFLGKPRFHRGHQMGPHEFFAELLFGNAFMKSPHGTWPTENGKGKWYGLAKNYRSTAKTVRYAGAYGGSTQTIYSEITATPGDDGSLPFGGTTYGEVETIRDTWMTKEPEWQKSWEREEALWRKQGFLADPIHGRRRYFLDQKVTDVVNYPILSVEAALMNEITLDLVKEIPHDIRRCTGLIQQNYDSVLLEVPEDQAERVAARVGELMTRKLPGMEVGFTGKPEIRSCWS